MRKPCAVSSTRTPKSLSKPHTLPPLVDMWQPYREAVHQCLPQATIVIDKFHAVKMPGKAYELKEAFYEVWDAKDKDEAMEAVRRITTIVV